MPHKLNASLLRATFSAVEKIALEGLQGNILKGHGRAHGLAFPSIQATGQSQCTGFLSRVGHRTDHGRSGRLDRHPHRSHIRPLRGARRLLATRFLIPVAVIACSLSGCSTLAVSHGEGPQSKKVGGVPFYVKKNAYRQVTTYAETKWDVVVSLEILPAATAKEGSARPLIQLTVPDSLFRGREMNGLRAAVTEANISGGVTGPQFKEVMTNVTTAGNSIQAMKLTDDCGAPYDSFKCPAVSNRIVRELVVDTSKTFYINGKRPLAGSAKSEFALGADLTLTTAKTEQDDKTLEQALSVLPVKEYLSKELGLETKATTKPEKATSMSVLQAHGASFNFAKRAVEEQATVYFRLAFEATPRVTLYDVFENLDEGTLAGGPKAKALLSLTDGRAGTGGVQFERKAVQPTVEAKKDEDDATGYKISGTIVVPKAAPAVPNAEKK